MKTFPQFIQSLHITNSPRGIFLADSKTLINAGKFPTVNNWSDLHRFMNNRGPEAIEHARKLWRRYKKEAVS